MSKRLFFPLLLALAGLGWLLNSLELVPEMPGINWLAIVLLSGSGLLLMLLNGINASTVLFGPLLMIAGLLWLLYQLGAMRLVVGLPVLLIAFALLWALSEHPRWRRRSHISSE